MAWKREMKQCSKADSHIAGYVQLLSLSLSLPPSPSPSPSLSPSFPLPPSLPSQILIFHDNTDCLCHVAREIHNYYVRVQGASLSKVFLLQKCPIWTASFHTTKIPNMLAPIKDTTVVTIYVQFFRKSAVVINRLWLCFHSHFCAVRVLRHHC